MDYSRMGAFPVRRSHPILIPHSQNRGKEKHPLIPEETVSLVHSASCNSLASLTEALSTTPPNSMNTPYTFDSRIVASYSPPKTSLLERAHLLNPFKRKESPMSGPMSGPISSTNPTASTSADSTSLVAHKKDKETPAVTASTASTAAATFTVKAPTDPGKLKNAVTPEVLNSSVNTLSADLDDFLRSPLNHTLAKLTDFANRFTKPLQALTATRALETNKVYSATNLVWDALVEKFMEAFLLAAANEKKASFEESLQKIKKAIDPAYEILENDLNEFSKDNFTSFFTEKALVALAKNMQQASNVLSSKQKEIALLKENLSHSLTQEISLLKDPSIAIVEACSSEVRKKILAEKERETTEFNSHASVEASKLDMYLASFQNTIQKATVLHQDATRGNTLKRDFEKAKSERQKLIGVPSIDISSKELKPRTDLNGIVLKLELLEQKLTDFVEALKDANNSLPFKEDFSVKKQQEQLTTYKNAFLSLQTLHEKASTSLQTPIMSLTNEEEPFPLATYHTLLKNLEAEYKKTESQTLTNLDASFNNLKNNINELFSRTETALNNTVFIDTQLTKGEERKTFLDKQALDIESSLKKLSDSIPVGIQQLTLFRSNSFDYQKAISTLATNWGTLSCDSTCSYLTTIQAELSLFKDNAYNPFAKDNTHNIFHATNSRFPVLSPSTKTYLKTSINNSFGEMQQTATSLLEKIEATLKEFLPVKEKIDSATALVTFKFEVIKEASDIHKAYSTESIKRYLEETKKTAESLAKKYPSGSSSEKQSFVESHASFYKNFADVVEEFKTKLHAAQDSIKNKEDQETLRKFVEEKNAELSVFTTNLDLLKSKLNRDAHQISTGVRPTETVANVMRWVPYSESVTNHTAVDYIGTYLNDKK